MAAYSSGFFALAGTIVGGLATFGSAFYFDRKRDVREERAASRLVADEVRTIWIHLKWLLAQDSNPNLQNSEGDDHFFSTSEWDTHKRSLATFLDDATWNKLAVLALLVSRQKLAFAKDQSRPLTADDRERFTDMSAMANEVYGLLTGQLNAPDGA